MIRSTIAPPNLRRVGVILAVVFAGLAPSGCARDRREITPTTLGTDLGEMPRGRMTPLPFPGSSLARHARGGPTTDPEATAAGLRVPTR